ncbi:unnamed protein product [Microthlaspi erraticum]|uniref:Uncharacterized protein n=1 Tax=Microthlaspi erraticum TaxID=1685480 RepID=A0A6D2KMA6_9BRAS|nr:unnamed protein product [Microthlaspi erraticum]
MLPAPGVLSTAVSISAIHSPNKRPNKVCMCEHLIDDDLINNNLPLLVDTHKETIIEDERRVWRGAHLEL